jgi:predicted nucleic-acid-binding protein
MNLIERLRVLSHNPNLSQDEYATVLEAIDAIEKLQAFVRSVGEP